ncbi:helix-turn-helix domain-containing protein [Streptomyces sp. NPDC051677]|uniref:helix-turn-helix domain-containing protein n=1 Tax=Streptomyces sp. NPDC051677 TaxID=3365669 RepID=UPI0037D4067C
MADPAAAVTRAVAHGVRAARTTRGWSLDALASRSGVSKGMLVLIEQDRTNPSIGTLCRLADALGTTLARLVETSETPPARVVRAGCGVCLWRSEHSPGRGVLLVGSEPPSSLEMWDWTMHEGDSYEGDAHVAGTKETVSVLRGSLEIQVADEPVVLHAGDSAVFAADRAHAYRHTGQGELRFVLAVAQSQSALLTPALDGSG